MAVGVKSYRPFLKLNKGGVTVGIRNLRGQDSSAGKTG